LTLDLSPEYLCDLSILYLLSKSRPTDVPQAIDFAESQGK
jgi:hypothetical protein